MTAEDAINRGWAIIRSADGRGIAHGFLVKGMAVFLSFALFFLLARTLGAHEFGVFSILFSVAGLFSAFATAGQQMLLVRSWSEYTALNDIARLKGALIFSAIMVLVGSAIITPLVMIGLSLTFSWPIAIAVCLYLFAVGVLSTTAHLVRTAIGLWLGDGLGSIANLALPIIYLPLCLMMGVDGRLETAFYLMAAGATVGTVWHVFMMIRMLHRDFPEFWSVKPKFDLEAWLARSIKLCLSKGLEACNQYIDVLIVGYLMTPTIAGAYFVMLRLANIFAVAGSAMDFFSSRHIPDLYYREEHSRLGQLLDTIALANLAVVGAGILAILAGGYWLLILLDPTYGAFYPALITLCLGTASVTAVGPAGFILVFSSHEGTALMATAASVAIRIIGFFLLIPLLAATGAVIATTLSLLVLAMALNLSARRLTGLDSSLLRLISGRHAGVGKTILS